MSLQGPLLVVADAPAPNLVEALGAGGAFPIVETNWADAPTAFVSVKPAAVVIAEPGAPKSEAAGRMLALQIATTQGAIVPIVAMADAERAAAIPTALTADAHQPLERLIERLRTALRVRALHSTVLRRIETFAAQGGVLPALPVGDPLDDATVLVAGRGPLYPALAVAMGEHTKMVGALSVEAAAKHLEERDIDGIVIGDGFSPKMIEAFLNVLGHESRFHEIPVAVMGEIPEGFEGDLPNLDCVDGAPDRLVSRMVPLVRLHALESRLKRMLHALDTDGMHDPETGLLTPEAFWRELNKAVDEASDRSHALTLARFSFDGVHDDRSRRDGARLSNKLMRAIDFACGDDDGTLLVAFTQTDLRSAHIVARRLAAAIKNIMRAPTNPNGRITANVTLASFKNGDTLQSLLQRVLASPMVAAE
ncbi:MAG: GGDEF domain-containing protein [Proteobacteria bacterium]|nr:GGDEF domain-containing protein [Pseudomonadota bacterium]